MTQRATVIGRTSVVEHVEGIFPLWDKYEPDAVGCICCCPASVEITFGSSCRDGAVGGGEGAGGGGGEDEALWPCTISQ